MSIERLRREAQARYMDGDIFGAEDAMRQVVDSFDRPNPSDALTLARLRIELGDLAGAEPLLDGLLEKAPFAPPIVSSAVRLYASQGQQERATELISGALQRHPDDPPLLALALTHFDDPPDAVTGRAEAVAAALPDDSEHKTILLYPLARLQDRRGQFERAWETMTRANELSRLRRGAEATLDAGSLYEQFGNRVRRAIELSRGLTPPETDGPEHVFLIGAPRTGSSLLQTVLAAHPGVASVGERGAMLRHLMEMCEAPRTASIDGLLSELAHADVAGLERQGHTEGVIVDKTPHNFYVAPLLRAAHPDASFVNVLRDPRDVAVSMLFHDFPVAFPEATRLASIERMLLARAEAALRYRDEGVPIHTMSFEAFLGDPEAEGRKLAKFAGISWDPGSLAAERRDSVVYNFSIRQVRREITPAAAGRWKRFEPQLAGFEDAFRTISALQDDLLAGSSAT